MSLLDEHITMTQAMTFSTFKGPFEERIENWNSTLQVSLGTLNAGRLVVVVADDTLRYFSRSHRAVDGAAFRRRLTRRWTIRLPYLFIFSKASVQLALESTKCLPRFEYAYQSIGVQYNTLPFLSLSSGGERAH